MRIIITGTPGTGKSVIATALARELGLEFISIKKIVLEKKLRERGGAVDLKKLARALAFLRRKKNYVAEGHLACEIRLPADAVVVLRTKPEILRARLQKRGYGKRKMNENLVAEILDYFSQRVEKVYGCTPLELDTSSRSVAESVGLLARAIRLKKKKLDRVEYPLVEYLVTGDLR